jgi:hypothetical protein
MIVVGVELAGLARHSQGRWDRTGWHETQRSEGAACCQGGGIDHYGAEGERVLAGEGRERATLTVPAKGLTPLVSTWPVIAIYGLEGANDCVQFLGVHEACGFLERGKKTTLGTLYGEAVELRLKATDLVRVKDRGEVFGALVVEARGLIVHLRRMFKQDLTACTLNEVEDKESSLSNRVLALQEAPRLRGQPLATPRCQAVADPLAPRL